MKAPADIIAHYTRMTLERAGMVVGCKPVGGGHIITEKEFQAEIIKVAESFGWEYHHQTISKRSKAGWPDLVLVRERVIYAELKTETGQLTADQLRWRDILQAAGQEWYCWRPNDWIAILEKLRAKARDDLQRSLDIAQAMNLRLAEHLHAAAEVLAIAARKNRADEFHPRLLAIIERLEDDRCAS